MAPRGVDLPAARSEEGIPKIKWRLSQRTAITLMAGRSAKNRRLQKQSINICQNLIEECFCFVYFFYVAVVFASSWEIRLRPSKPTQKQTIHVIYGDFFFFRLARISKGTLHVFTQLADWAFFCARAITQNIRHTRLVHIVIDMERVRVYLWCLYRLCSILWKIIMLSGRNSVYLFFCFVNDAFGDYMNIKI